jgi:hypothetical protein
MADSRVFSDKKIQQISNLNFLIFIDVFHKRSSGNEQPTKILLTTLTMEQNSTFREKVLIIRREYTYV